MASETYTLEFSDRVSLLLDQRSQLLDSLILANQKLDEKADRSIQTGGLLLGLVAIITALPFNGPIEFGKQATTYITYTQILLVIISLFSFLKVVWKALEVNRPRPWQGAGDTDWVNNSTRYLGSGSHDILLADLLETIDSTQDLNKTKANYTDQINWWLKCEVIMLTLVFTITLIIGP